MYPNYTRETKFSHTFISRAEVESTQNNSIKFIIIDKIGNFRRNFEKSITNDDQKQHLSLFYIFQLVKKLNYFVILHLQKITSL